MKLDQVENVRKSCYAGKMVSVSVDCPNCDARGCSAGRMRNRAADNR